MSLRAAANADSTKQPKALDLESAVMHDAIAPAAANPQVPFKPREIGRVLPGVLSGPRLAGSEF